MSKLNNVLLIGVVLILQKYSVQSYVAMGDDCITPLNETTKCIPLANCQLLTNFLERVGETTPQMAESVKSFFCNQQTEDSSVCCPSSKFFIDRDGKVISLPPPIPDVSNHENLKYLPEDCGLAKDTELIIGGEDAKLLEFPWMALLIYRDTRTKKLIDNCGGSILNERYILTAAHCIIFDEPFEFEGVRVGEYSLLSEKDCSDTDTEKCLPPVQHLLVEESIVHPKYNPPVSRFNDIALLRVTKINMEPVSVKPICLPVHQDVLNKPYERGVVSGWGRTDPYGKNVTDKLQKIYLSKKDIETCPWFENTTISDVTYKSLCLGGEENKDTCGGDSGSPFQVLDYYNDQFRYFQRGLVSYGRRICGTKDYPGVYVNVDYYLQWILDNIAP